MGRTKKEEIVENTEEVKVKRTRNFSFWKV